MSLSAIDCARARESISAQLDGELAELELDRLETHLLLCPACTAWAEDVRAMVGLLRAAPLEEPAGRFVLPRLRRGLRVSSAVAVASAAAVVATMFLAPGRQTSVGAQAGPQVVRFAGNELPGGQVLADGVFIGVSVNMEHASFDPV